MKEHKMTNKGIFFALKYFYEINEIDSFIKAEMLDKDENQFKTNEDIRNSQHIDIDEFNCEISDKEDFQYFLHNDDYPKICEISQYLKEPMKKENSNGIVKKEYLKIWI